MTSYSSQERLLKMWVVETNNGIHTTLNMGHGIKFKLENFTFILLLKHLYQFINFKHRSFSLSQKYLLWCENVSGIIPSDLKLGWVGEPD